MTQCLFYGFDVCGLGNIGLWLIGPSTDPACLGTISLNEKMRQPLPGNLTRTSSPQIGP